MFNNAGIAILGEERDVSLDDWRRVLDVDLYGVVHGVRAAYPIMVKQGAGHIVNTASLAGLVPAPGEASYAAAKFGVVGLSYTLRVEGAALGVKVSVVCPGFIDTPILTVSPIRYATDRARMMALAPTPMAPEECAETILRGVEKNRATIDRDGARQSARLAPANEPGARPLESGEGSSAGCARCEAGLLPRLEAPRPRRRPLRKLEDKVRTLLYPSPRASLPSSLRSLPTSAASLAAPSSRLQRPQPSGGSSPGAMASTMRIDDWWRLHS